jgi:LytS/YehU family sensor histidine kinase
MVKSGESEEAYNYLSKNSKLIRTLMDESNKITRSLKQEISFVEDYLALQKIRFKERYDFTIEIKGEVNLNVEIPKMIIHTYVENAIKHGLSKIRENGKLEIEISQSSKRKYTFVVSDNGSGIDPVQVEQNKGRGLKLMDEYFRLFEDYYDYKISTSIGQKNPERPGQPGTIVQISLELPPEYF